MITYIIEDMASKGCHRISIVLVLTCGRAKTIGIRSVPRIFLFENGEKNFRFKKYTDTCGQGLKLQKKT